MFSAAPALSLNAFLSATVAVAFAVAGTVVLVYAVFAFSWRTILDIRAYLRWTRPGAQLRGERPTPIAEPEDGPHSRKSKAQHKPGRGSTRIQTIPLRGPLCCRRRCGAYRPPELLLDQEPALDERWNFVLDGTEADGSQQE